MKEKFYGGYAMPVCQTCHYKWSWIETMKKSYKIQLQCPKCKTKQFITKKSRWRFWFVTVIALVFLPISTQLSINKVISFIVFFLIYIVAICFYPFVIKLTNEEEEMY